SRLLTIVGSDQNRAQKIRDHEFKLEQENAKLLLMQEENRELRALKKKTNDNQKARMRRLNRDIRDARANIKTLEEQAPAANFAMGVKDGRVADARVLIRGEIRNQGPVVKRGFLQVLDHVKAYPIGSRASGRMQLASWLTQPDNPLTARVMVNRVWHHLFGAGIVRTVDNFGATGEHPSHPELLDHLAMKFVENNWSVKSLIREIVLSRTYQLSSEMVEDNLKGDPNNRLLWRMNHKRLSAESLRDAMLATSGRLNPQPAVGSEITKIGDVIAARAMRQLSQGQRNTNQRSVYLPIMRNSLPEMMRIFDAAEPSLIVGKRNETTVPTQALYLMNSPFVSNQAVAMARRIMNRTEQPAEGIRLAYELAFARAATDDEVSKAQNFLSEVSEEKDTPGQWAVFCQALIASAEFRYIH
ncbi:MAG: DUF1553 domain-containing protein, partial [Verrucomicrobiales bacterium]|nr:DUF1553 domain-containing protein [Verrucomicrobiales bacterium]